ncbi:hypothetical protein D3C81_1373180 [compost metagenome]
MCGAFAQQRPHHAFQLRQIWCDIAFAQRLLCRRQQRALQRVQGDSTEATRHAIAHRIDAGVALPITADGFQSLQRRIVTVFQRLPHQLPPTLHQQGPVVELDRQQVTFGEALTCEQSVADLLCTRAEVIATVAGNRQRVAIKHAAIRGPQAVVGRVDQGRGVIGTHCPGLAGRVGAFRHRRIRCIGDAADVAVADAIRASANQPPADATFAVTDQQVLCRNAGAIGNGQCGIEIGGLGHVGEFQLHRALQLACPPQRKQAAVRVFARHRPPAALTYDEGFR